MRRVSFSTAVLPSVATEIFGCARSIVTASSAGSSASVSTTERARQVSVPPRRAEDFSGAEFIRQLIFNTLRSMARRKKGIEKNNFGLSKFPHAWQLGRALA